MNRPFEWYVSRQSKSHHHHLIPALQLPQNYEARQSVLYICASILSPSTGSRSSSQRLGQTCSRRVLLSKNTHRICLPTCFGRSILLIPYLSDLSSQRFINGPYIWVRKPPLHFFSMTHASIFRFPQRKHSNWHVITYPV